MKYNCCKKCHSENQIDYVHKVNIIHKHTGLQRSESYGKLCLDCNYFQETSRGFGFFGAWITQKDIHLTMNKREVK